MKISVQKIKYVITLICVNLSCWKKKRGIQKGKQDK